MVDSFIRVLAVLCTVGKRTNISMPYYKTRLASLCIIILLEQTENYEYITFVALLICVRYQGVLIYEKWLIVVVCHVVITYDSWI